MVNTPNDADQDNRTPGHEDESTPADAVKDAMEKHFADTEKRQRAKRTALGKQAAKERRKVKEQEGS